MVRPDAPPDDQTALLIFRVGPVYCCAPSGPVSGIIVPPPLHRPPGSNPDRPGVFRHGRQVVSVIDLRQRFGVPESGRSDPGRLIIADLEQGHTGFRVDAIVDVEAMPGSGWGGLPALLPRGVFLRTLLRDERIHLYAEFAALAGIPRSDYLREWIAQVEKSEIENAPADETDTSAVSPEKNRSERSGTTSRRHERLPTCPAGATVPKSDPESDSNPDSAQGAEPASSPTSPRPANPGPAATRKAAPAPVASARALGKAEPASVRTGAAVAAPVKAPPSSIRSADAKPSVHPVPPVAPARDAQEAGTGAAGIAAGKSARFNASRGQNPKAIPHPNVVAMRAEGSSSRSRSDSPPAQDSRAVTRPTVPPPQSGHEGLLFLIAGAVLVLGIGLIAWQMREPGRTIQEGGEWKTTTYAVAGEAEFGTPAKSSYFDELAESATPTESPPTESLSESSPMASTTESTTEFGAEFGTPIELPPIELPIESNPTESVTESTAAAVSVISPPSTIESEPPAPSSPGHARIERNAEGITIVLNAPESMSVSKAAT